MGKITVRRRGSESTVTQEVRGHRIAVRVDLGEEPPQVVGMTFAATDGGAVSPREVRRLPLSDVVEASILAATISFATEGPYSLDTAALSRARSKLAETARRVAMPRGRPQRGRSAKWYLDLLATYREMEAQGIRAPAALIAKRKGVDPNLVHQWIHRARDIERRGKEKR